MREKTHTLRPETAQAPPASPASPTSLIYHPRDWALLRPDAVLRYISLAGSLDAEPLAEKGKLGVRALNEDLCSGRLRAALVTPDGPPTLTLLTRSYWARRKVFVADPRRPADGMNVTDYEAGTYVVWRADLDRLTSPTPPTTLPDWQLHAEELVPEPASAVEPEPAVESAPVVESVPVVEPAPAVEPEPAVGPSPAAADMDVLAPATGATLPPAEGSPPPAREAAVAPTSNAEVGPENQPKLTEPDEPAVAEPVPSAEPLPGPSSTAALAAVDGKAEQLEQMAKAAVTDGVTAALAAAASKSPALELTATATPEVAISKLPALDPALAEASSTSSPEPELSAEPEPTKAEPEPTKAEPEPTSPSPQAGPEPSPEPKRRAPEKAARRARPGPSPGTIDRFAPADRALFPKMTALIKRECITAGEAARKLSSKIEGRGTDNSKARRLAERYRTEVEKLTATRRNS